MHNNYQVTPTVTLMLLFYNKAEQRDTHGQQQRPFWKKNVMNHWTGNRVNPLMLQQQRERTELV